MAACPSRELLYTKLSEDRDGGEPVPQEELEADLNAWLAALQEIIARIDLFYEKNGYKKGL